MNDSAADFPPPDTLAAAVQAAIGTVLDPEFGISVADLGLIYSIEIGPARGRIVMTLTSMYCPAGQVIMDGVRAVAESVSGGRAVDVDLVWDPAWTADCMTAAGRAALGWDAPIVEE